MGLNRDQLQFGGGWRRGLGVIEPRITGCDAPVAEGILAGIPSSVDAPRRAKAMASLAWAGIPKSSAVRISTAGRRRRRFCMMAAFSTPPPLGMSWSGRNGVIASAMARAVMAAAVASRSVRVLSAEC